MPKLTGLIAATYTPMHADGRLALDKVDELAERLIADGVSGAFLCGTTGEFASLTAVERAAVCERWVAATAGRIAVIAHVGGTCAQQSKALASRAQMAGVDAIACIAPYFFKPRTVEDLVAYCAEVAAAAPEVPFYYYHLPALTDVDLPMVEFLRIGADRIPMLAGVKFSHNNLMDLAQCVALDDGRYDLLFGCDETLLSGLAFGCEGAVGTTYGFAAPLYHRIIDAFAAGDVATAQRLQLRSIEWVSIFVRFGGHRAMKAVMKLSGIDCGPVRPPLAPLSDEEYEELTNELTAAGFDEARASAPACPRSEAV